MRVAIEKKDLIEMATEEKLRSYDERTAAAKKARRAAQKAEKSRRAENKRQTAQAGRHEGGHTSSEGDAGGADEDGMSSSGDDVVTRLAQSLRKHAEDTLRAAAPNGGLGHVGGRGAQAEGETELLFRRLLTTVEGVEGKDGGEGGEDIGNDAGRVGGEKGGKRAIEPDEAQHKKEGRAMQHLEWIACNQVSEGTIPQEKERSDSAIGWDEQRPRVVGKSEVLTEAALTVTDLELLDVSRSSSLRCPATDVVWCVSTGSAPGPPEASRMSAKHKAAARAAKKAAAAAAEASRVNSVDDDEALKKGKGKHKRGGN